MNAKQMCGAILALFVAVVGARADSLELKNGSLIKGKFMGGTQTSISFQVGSSVQSYDVADILSLLFESEARGASPSVPSKQPSVPSSIEKEKNEVAKSSSSATIPAGTRISVRTTDSIDSAKNRVGYRFQASLALSVDGNVVVPKGADVYDRLDESKGTGTFAGRSQLKLQLTGIVINGQTLPLVTWRIRSLRQVQDRALTTAGVQAHVIYADDFRECVKQHGRAVAGRRLT